ncbi:carboxylic ester hydrolase-22 [Coleophoma crateriformis]|uniref:Carboxylic ester hydrolase n=1 Tax=Coleophoma crateriformis TaxID=565419 RepID=A0A3D8SLK1_9HELO|nr:carboxylic ester hydrolase-22 [Coleophoma crateriformis]
MGVLKVVQVYLSGLLAASSFHPALNTLPQPIVFVANQSFTGIIINSTLTGHPLPVPVNALLGIDYASQPVGEDRFKPVRPLILGNWSGGIDASRYGKVCIQDPRFISYEQDEACLNMNIYWSITEARKEKLPVLVWIHGGGFVSGSGRSFDGASFVGTSKSPLMVVTFNYRLNSLGFLPSGMFEKEGLLNLGLLDQLQLLEFVQEHISSFGGDPENVTLGGRSAGAHSVGIHYFHNYTTGSTEAKSGKALFSKAILQSGSVTARSFPGATYPLYEAQFAKYLSLIGCAGLHGVPETLQCLRTVDISIIRDASTQLFQESEYAITWPFQPTLGGPLFEMPGSISGAQGMFYRLPVITTTVNDEAKLYTPGNLTSNEQFLEFMHNLTPYLNTTDMELLETLYPDPLTSSDGTPPYSDSPNSTQYNRLSAAVSDYMYICPSQETAVRTSSAGVPTWKLRFNTNNSFPAWQGIPHTADTRYTWNAPAEELQFPQIGSILHGYFSSFVVTGDPSQLRILEDTLQSPEWPSYISNGDEIGRQLVLEPGSARIEDDMIRKEQCAFWRDLERSGRLGK